MIIESLKTCSSRRGLYLNAAFALMSSLRLVTSATDCCFTGAAGSVTKSLSELFIDLLSHTKAQQEARNTSLLGAI